ncbi:T-RNA-binding domain-containing protein [Balamuthia mandrillaris]
MEGKQKQRRTKSPQERKKFIAWASTPLLHNIARKQRFGPVVTYRAKIKLHGRNVGIHVTRGGMVYTQSRNGLEAGGRYAGQGFAYWVRSHERYFASRRAIAMRLFFPNFQSSSPVDFVIFGEWCGRNINNGAIVCRLWPRFLAVFAILVGEQLIICPKKIEQVMLAPAEKAEPTRPNDKAEDEKAEEGMTDVTDGKHNTKEKEEEERVEVNINKEENEDKGNKEYKAEEEEEEEEEEEQEEEEEEEEDEDEEDEEKNNGEKPKDLYVLPWATKKVQLDFSDSNQMSAQLPYINRVVELVDHEDPWIKQTFGLSGVGEGVVFYPVSLATNNKRGSSGDIKDGILSKCLFDNYLFKVKGPTHQERSLSSPAMLNPEHLKSLTAFVDTFVTGPRLQHGLMEMNGGGSGMFRRSQVDDFVEWMIRDVEKESKDEMAAAVEEQKFMWEQVEKEVENKAKAWYLAGLVEQTGERSGRVLTKEKEKEEKEISQEKKQALEKKKQRRKVRREQTRKSSPHSKVAAEGKGESEEEEEDGDEQKQPPRNVFDLLAEEEAC